VIPSSVVIHDRIRDIWEPLCLERTYGVATKVFMREGRDGYVSLLGCERTVDEDLLEGQFNNCMRITLLEMEVVSAFQEAATERHMERSRCVTHAALKLRRKGMLARDPSADSSDDDRGGEDGAPRGGSKSRRPRRQGADVTKRSLTQDEQANFTAFMMKLLPRGAAIAPAVDGRVTLVN